MSNDALAVVNPTASAELGLVLHGGVRTASASAIAIVVFVVLTPVLLLAGAFTLRLAFGVARYRDLGLPTVVYAVALIGGAGLSMLTFRRLRVRT